MATNILTLTEQLTLAGEDLFVCVDDPSGAGTVKKVLASTVLAYVQANLGFEDVTFGNTGLKIEDTDASHVLTISPGSNLTADRTLTITTGDAGRTITLSGNPTLADWFDQSVKTSADPAFNTIKLNDSDDSHTVQILVSSNLTANRTLTLATGDGSRTVTLSADLTVEAASLINQDLTTDSSVVQFARLGINASAPSNTGQVQITSATYPVVRATRTTSTTNAVAAALDFTAESSGTVVDNFGGGLTASIAGSGLSSIFIAGFYGVRAGADNKGAFAIYTRNGPSSTTDWLEKCRVTPAGNFLVGHTTPPTTGTACVALETETAPTAVVADTFAMYSADASGAGTAAPHFMTESGNAVIKLYRLSALTTQLTTITHTEPGTPDYAIQNLTAGGFGFVTADEGNSVLKVVANLQTRVAELEARLKSLGILPP